MPYRSVGEAALRAFPMAILLAMCAAHRADSAEDLPVMLTVDYRDPIPPELLKKAHIEAVYVGVGLPVRDGKLDEKTRPQLESFLKLYGEHGIKVLLESNFYARPPKGTECTDAHGRTIRMACFNNDDVHAWMRRKIREMAECFGAYPAFGGFLFDDGVQVRCDCCYCEVCRRLFKEKHGVEPPPFEPTKGTGRLEPGDPRLLWDAFHREGYARYLRTQAEAARSVSDKLTLVTIPSDSFHFGRHLNAAVARDATGTTGGARLQRMDRLHVRNWHVFQSFPVPRVVPDGNGQEPWAVGCHLTTPSPCMILHQDGPLIETAGRQQFLSPAEIRRLMHTTIAEGADAIGFWENARAVSHCPEVFDAVGSVVEEVRKLRPTLDARKPFPARVGLLYSTATEIVQQPWQENTSERWRHLHAFEAMAYALTRHSIQFHVVLDSELDDALPGLHALILAGVSHLTRPVAERIEKAVASERLFVLTDPTCLPIAGAKECKFDPDAWLSRQRRGYRHTRYLDDQAAEIADKAVSQLRLFSLQPLQVEGGACFARLFAGPEKSLLVFLVNWDARWPSNARLTFREPYALDGLIGGAVPARVAAGHHIDLEVEPAGWRVLRCKSTD